MTEKQKRGLSRQKKTAVAEGETTAVLLETLRQPGEGDRLPQVSGIGGGRTLLRTSAKTADARYLCLGTWRFKGTKITSL